MMDDGETLAPCPVSLTEREAAYSAICAVNLYRRGAQRRIAFYFQRYYNFAPTFRSCDDQSSFRVKFPCKIREYVRIDGTNIFVGILAYGSPMSGAAAQWPASRISFANCSSA